jgi:hypothetical protein
MTIMTRASRRMFEALEPSDASSDLPEWLVAVQAERAAEAARLATPTRYATDDFTAVLARWAR